jgi:hypothetical protein
MVFRQFRRAFRQFRRLNGSSGGRTAVCTKKGPPQVVPDAKRQFWIVFRQFRTLFRQFRDQIAANQKAGIVINPAIRNSAANDMLHLERQFRIPHLGLLI